MPAIRVLHVIPGFYPAVRYGGPIQSVLGLCQALTRAGVELEVATTDADGPGDLRVPIGECVDVQGVPVRYFRRRPRFGYAFSRGLAAYLAGNSSRFDLVHVTSAFSFPSAAACVAAQIARRPYIVSPRGSLTSWALAHKRWKKLPYWHLVERRNLSGAASLHATSEVEQHEIQGAVPGPRVFVVPNGVDLPASPGRVPRAPRRIVFLGRIHPVKGFDVLVPALSQVAAVMPDVETIVAGNDDAGEWRNVASAIERASPRPDVRYVGPVAGAAKAELLGAAQVLVLPSHSENFGQVVVEALACGTPVVVSRNCPWQSVEEAGAGAWVENTPTSIAAALLRILEDPEKARAMGIAGRRLAAAYSWAGVAAAMIREYEHVLARPVEGGLG